MVAMPAATPVTVPVVDVVSTTLAIVVLLLAQVPPALELKTVVLPWHTTGVPVSVDGGGLRSTVTVVLPGQPFVAVAVTVKVCVEVIGLAVGLAITVELSMGSAVQVNEGWGNANRHASGVSL